MLFSVFFILLKYIYIYKLIVIIFNVVFVIFFLLHALSFLTYISVFNYIHTFFNIQTKIFPSIFSSINRVVFIFVVKKNYRVKRGRQRPSCLSRVLIAQQNFWLREIYVDFKLTSSVQFWFFILGITIVVPRTYYYYSTFKRQVKTKQ